MTFISYAQNYEDVMLHRALKSVDKGFYIDVGANDPVVDSVTKAFYDAGWRGINIDPVSEWFKKLQNERPHDINLQVAAGAHKDNLNFYEVVGTGLSTLNETIAQRHAQERGFEIKSYKVPVVKLSSICEQYPCPNIHFLKIDVEGAELSVLQGLDLVKIRPWIILVETTQPLTQIESHSEWEYSILGRGYHSAYFDGLNRYYVADEHDELDSAFNMPPNIFDDFKRANEDWLEHQVQRLENELDSSKDNLKQMESSAHQIETVLQGTDQQRQQLEVKVETLLAETKQRDLRLKEQEAKHKELLLTLLEKESRLQDVTATLMHNKRQIENLYSSLADSQKQQQSFDAAQQKIEQQYQQLEMRFQSRRSEFDRRDKRLREKEEKHQELLLSLVEKETKLQEIKTLLSEKKRNIEDLQASLADSKNQKKVLEVIKRETEQQRDQLEVTTASLQVKNDHLAKQLDEKDLFISSLKHELQEAMYQIDKLHQSNHHWWSLADQKQKELDEAKTKIDELNRSSHHWWLEAEQKNKELDESKAKINEINRSSHHWWLEADRLNKELQALYSSKSWRLTWPVRKLKQGMSKLLSVPNQVLIWFVRLLKQIVRWLLLHGIAYVTKHPGLKARVIYWLHNYPRLKSRLQSLARTGGVSANSSKILDGAAAELPENEVTVGGREVTRSQVELSQMTESARRIYALLKAAIEIRQKENG